MPEPRALRIAILGPESTGKSTLAEQLAAHYRTVWVPEFARNFLSGLDRPYTETDVLRCFDEQLAAEDRLLPLANRLLFCDTEVINFRVWMLYRFGHCPSHITDAWTGRYDGYLLTYPDLAFEPDPLREHPGRRYFFFDWYKRELDARGAAYGIVTGAANDRFDNARRIIDRLLSGMDQ
jgi:nicotinamide riboside kinase